jgi:rhodanese-related sulfurtransferase
LKKFASIERTVDLINHKNARIFDIRTSNVFNKGHIKNAFNVDLLNIKNKRYLLNKNTKNCIIICSDNNQNADKAMKVLKKEGMEQIYILKGGINAWQNAGFPLEKKKILNK